MASAPLHGQILPEALLLAPLLVVNPWLSAGGIPDIPDADSKKNQRQDGAAMMSQKTGLPAPFEELVKIVAVSLEEHAVTMGNTCQRLKHDPVTNP